MFQQYFSDLIKWWCFGGGGVVMMWWWASLFIITITVFV